MKLLCLLLIGLAGCYADDRAVKENGDPDGWSWSIVKFDGHDYVKAHASGHGNIVHSPNCPCMKPAKE
jgi:hypothetical protein